MGPTHLQAPTCVKFPAEGFFEYGVGIMGRRIFSEFGVAVAESLQKGFLEYGQIKGRRGLF